MSRILVLGNGPMPAPGQRASHNAVTLRTIFFRDVLEQAGNEVHLVLIVTEEGLIPSDSATRHFLASEPGLPSKLRAEIDRVKPDGVVAVNNAQAYLAVQTGAEQPMWLDLNGWLLAETQSAAGVTGNDYLVPHRVTQEKAVMRRGDRFSAVSGPQRFALLGELAMLGRLSSATDEEPIVCSIPNTWPTPVDVCRYDPPTAGRPFTVFFCGGYNTWLDVDTLFDGLVAAMEADPDVRFVSTGGQIKGMGGDMLGRFRTRIDASPHRDRFQFLGWVAQDELPALFDEADLGINVDRPNAESLTGARNRINEMLARGLPVLTSRITEISEELEAFGAAATFPVGDSAAMGARIVGLRRDPAALLALRERGLLAAAELYGPQVHTQGLLAWAARPVRAGDAGRPSLESASALRSLLDSLRNDGIGRTLARVRKRLIRR
jgi:glycosyltransferase involved in cell wall biosynthesis